MKITDIGILCTLIISLLNIYINIKQMKQQKKIEEKKISAEIMSKSRIKWIQDVRETITEIFSAFDHLYIVDYECSKKYYQAEYKPELEIASNELISKINKLILYFANSNDGKPSGLDITGEMLSKPFPYDLNYLTPEEISAIREAEHDDKKNTQKKKENNTRILNHLYESKTNKFKNRLIVELLDELLKSSRVQFFEYQKDLVEKRNKNYPITHCYSRVYTSRIDTCRRYMNELRNILALYLKIEWDKAKMGE